MNNSRIFPEDMVKLLGSNFDPEIAKQTGFCKQTILSERKKRNIKPYKHLSDIDKIAKIKNYLENNKYSYMKNLYKFCGFTKIFGSSLTLKTLKFLIKEENIKPVSKKLLDSKFIKLRKIRKDAKIK